MPTIHLLPEDLINKIAAGEVIERPASVVKELLENSLDAGATQISIDIEDSGKKRIKIKDNGQGMDAEDARNSLLRHATSKISSVDDLFRLQTLGFRGEALASIAAVSHLTITTKQQNQLEGHQLQVQGGQIISSKAAAAEEGTTMDVQDLFFNTPARRKFLKTDAVELRHILEVATNYALLHKHISLSLKHNGQMLLQAPAAKDLQAKMASIYGAAAAKDLLEVSFSSHSITIHGLISTPYAARNDKSMQSLFVNGRWIKNEGITRALYEAYHSLLFVNKHPAAILFLSVLPSAIDVNVHPNKMSIKFEQAEEVERAVHAAVRQTLEKNNLIPTLQEEMQLSFGLPRSSIQQKRPYAFEQSTQHILPELQQPELAEDKSLSSLPSALVASSSSSSPSSSSLTSPSFSSSSFSSSYQPPSLQSAILQPDIYHKIPPLKLLGQIQKTFFVAETEGGAFFIDQHAAHERVLYEQFMEQFMKKKVEVQQLLQPEVLEFSPADTVTIQEHLSELQQLGFFLEPFGQQAFIVKMIPTIFGRTQSAAVVQEIIEVLQDRKSSVEKIKEEIITSMACRAAVMAGEELTNQQMKDILDQLGRCRLPFTCPHGRPTIIKTEAEELEKKFRRR